MTQRRSWTELKQELLPDTPEVREAYERTRRAHELGARIRELRESRGLSQAELARRLGTTQSAIARLELGGVDPRLDTLARIATALDADLALDLHPRSVSSASAS